MDIQKQKILTIAGPTAIGKSGLAIKLAKLFDAEIISADSMQIYKGLDIGTGKVTDKEMDGVKHHLIDIINPEQNFSVSDFVSLSKDKITEIIGRSKKVIIAGGTGLYINALINGYNFAGGEADDKIRAKYNKLQEEKGNQYLYNLLQNCDPKSADKISINDTKRIIRALEIFEVTGSAKSENATQNQESEYDSLVVILDDDRQKLYDKINLRVDCMIKAGLVEEAKKHIALKDCQSMQAIGYKEFVDYFDNKTTIDQTIELIKKNSRNYAKRQLTYFRWVKLEKEFFNVHNIEEIIEKCKKFYSVSDIT